MQQQQLQQPSGPPGLNPMSASSVPRGPGGPLPVDVFGCLSRLVQEGSEMRGNTFVTSRGDQINCPQHGQIGGPYPKIDEMSERI